MFSLEDSHLHRHPVSPLPDRFRRPIIAELRERRFAAGLYCPRCGGRRLHRWGHFSGRRRYRCRDCNRTFSDLTATPIERTRYPELWPRFCALLLNGASVRECARQLGIDKSTAWRWRHRLLDTLRSESPPSLHGIVEVHETTFAHSQKGSRDLRDARGRPRPPRLRGAGRGRDHRRAWVLLLRARSGLYRAEYVGDRRPGVHQLNDVLDARTTNTIDVLLSRWGPLSSWGRWCRGRGIRFAHANGSGAIRGPALRPRIENRGQACTPSAPSPSPGGSNIGHASVRALNASAVTVPSAPTRTHEMDWRLRNRLRRFRGVATRYLPNYLHWFALHERLRAPAEQVLTRVLWPRPSLTTSDAGTVTG